MNTYNGLPLLKISLEDTEQGVEKISLVDEPAIMENWVHFSKLKDEELNLIFAEITEEQKLAGPLLIPDIPILRRHPETKEKFYVQFPKEVIKEIANRFNKNLNGANWNVDHKKDITDVYVSENWIIEHSEFDKSRKFGHSLPVGTWYGIVKVDNNKIWKKEIQTGKLKGFSVELVSGLSLSAVEKSICDFEFENHIESILKTDSFGEKLNPNWKQIACIDIDENESEFSDEALIKMSIQADGNAESSLDVSTKNGEYRVRYKYNGPRDKKNRTFCANLLNFQGSDTIFRREDINQMSFTTSNPQFGTYSIWNYKGSYGCRHKWQRLIFFEANDSENEIRVGNVPAVTGRINDKKARTINANLKNNKMAEKSKFAMLEDLPVDERIVGASVDNENGEYEIEGVKYLIADNLITEVISEVTDGDVSEEETINPEDLKKFMGEVLGLLAEQQSQIEALNSKVNGADESSHEQFSKIGKGLEGITALLSLLPAKDQDKKIETEIVAGTIATALQRIKEESAKR